MGKYIGCAGSGKDRFVIKKLHIDRSFPGTGDLWWPAQCSSAR